MFSVERIRPLQEKARKRLRHLGLHNVHLRHADGGMGWPERGPFDAILSAAAPEVVPAELLEQLAVGGRLVIPVGEQGKPQSLYVYDRHEDGIEEQCIEPVLFVPLVGGVVA